jgi:hypothetical protein
MRVVRRTRERSPKSHCRDKPGQDQANYGVPSVVNESRFVVSSLHTGGIIQ